MINSTTKTTVAIIGLGNIGKALATNLIKGKHPVILASREIEKSNAFAYELGSLAIAKETADAIKEAEVIIPYEKNGEIIGAIVFLHGD